MTYLDFHRELCRGKGSCFYELQKEPDRYRNILMYAATRSTAFDPQCEGTRADYIHELLLQTSDPKPYLDAAITSFKEASPLCRDLIKEETADDDEKPQFAKNPAPSDHDFHFLADLLALFAKDGYREAWEAIVMEYDRLFRHLANLTERPAPFFPARDDFEELAILVCESGLADVMIPVRDIGTLFENPLYTNFDFDQFHDIIGIPHRDTLKSHKDDAAISRYLAVYYPVFINDPASPKAHRHEEEFEDLIAEYLTEPPTVHLPPHARAAKTSDPHALMATVDENADADEVEAALLSLAKIRHPDVRSWALSRLESDPARYLPIVMKNYTEEDRFELCYELKQVPVDPYGDGAWHGVQLSLLDMEEDGITPPYEALRFVVRYTLCSCCRLKAIKQLHGQNMLSSEILTDALHDSNFDIRAFVSSVLSE